jgi:hypothetical protein
MMKFFRFLLALLGFLSVGLGGYFGVLDGLVRREITHLKQGNLRHSWAERLEKFPFAPKDLLEYNASVLLFQRRTDVTFTVDRLNRVIAETKDPGTRFRAYVLLAHIYSRSGAEYAFEIGPEYAIDLYIQALRIKPEDYDAKLALEKLLSRVEKEEKKDREKERMQQSLPREGGKGKEWSTLEKGDSL